MKELSSINIMCMGSWNKRIFVPAWVSQNIFKLEGKEIQGLVNPIEMEIGYSHNDVSLLPKDHSLEIRLEKITEVSKEFAGDVLLRILNLLPHTPIRAIGVNVRYVFDKENKYSIVRTLDEFKCTIANFTTKQIIFSKSYTQYLLNIITDIEDNQYNVNFNYHYTALNSLTRDIIQVLINNSKSLIIDE